MRPGREPSVNMPLSSGSTGGTQMNLPAVIAAGIQP
jgi:hypothetical protein